MSEDIKNKGGRPTTYTKEVGDSMCDRLASGESLRSICNDEDMPNKGVFFGWLSRNKELADQYARAKEYGVEALVEDIFDIADDTSQDYIYSVDEDGNETKRLNSEHIQRSRLRVDTRKWYVGKVKPKKYGEKLSIGGADDLPPIDNKLTIEIISKSQETD